MRPREVRLTAGGWALLALAAVLVVGGVAGGITLHLKVVRDADEARGFQERALDTTGVVTRKWRARDGDDRPRWVAYDFSANGRVFRGEARASRALWERLEPGSPVPVRFDAERPERHFPWGRRPGTTPPVLAYFVGLAGLLAGGLVTIPILRQRRLMAEGRAALATVTGKTKGQHGTTINYEFHVLSGGLVKGSSGAPSKPPEVGSTMWVVYATENPSWSSPYPSSLVRLARRTALRPSPGGENDARPAAPSRRQHAAPR